MPQRIPSPFAPAARPVIEPIVQPLYDVVTLATTLATDNLFFAVPRGQTGKTFRDTNIDTAGSLPSPKIFVILNLNINVSQDGASSLANQVTDLNDILYQTAFNLFIGTKDYLNVPTYMLPSNYGIRANFGGAATDTSAYHGGPIFRTERKPITIPPQQNFSANIQPKGTVTLNATRDVWCIMGGDFGREVQ